MANTFVDYTVGAGQTDFAFSFPFLDDSHVVVQLDDSTVNSPGGKFYTVSTGDYTIITSPSTLIRFTTAPETGARLRIKRDSISSTALVDFENGSVLTETELDRAYLHNLYLSEELEEGGGKNTMTKNDSGNYDGDKARIIDVADPVDPQDVATKNYTDTTFVDVAGDTMTGNLDMGSNKITSSTAPSSGNDLTNKTYVDGQDALQVTKAGDNMTGDLAMGGNMVSGLGAPLSSDHSARKGYVDQQDNLQVTKSGDTMSGNLQMGSNKITGLGTPSALNDAANKSYVDSNIASTLATGVAGGQVNTVNIADSAITADKLADTTVTPGAYTNTNLTVDQKGRITAASSSSAADIKTLYESNPNTNEFDDAEQTKLAGIATGATANDTDSNLKNRANHTGTQTASTISDFDTEVANNTAVAANTAKVGLNGPVQNDAVKGPGPNDVIYGDTDAFQNAGSNTLNNTMFGRGAGECIESASGGANIVIRNTAFGQNALGLISFTQPSPNAIGANVAVGGLSLVNCTGSFNTVVGTSSAYSSGNAYAHSNTTVLGAGTTATGDNQVVLGDTNVTSLKCNVTTITSLSDERTKENIKDSTLGLEFINELKTKTFNKKNPADWEEGILEERYRDKNDEEYKRPSDNPATYTGLIAQEVKGVLDKLNISEWDGWNEEPNGIQRLGYGALIMPLIKAVQELSAQVEELKNKV